MSRKEEAAGANGGESLTPVTTLIPKFQQENAVQRLQNTLEYATSPKNYLVRILGKDVVEKNSHLLSIPAQLVDTDVYGTGVHKQQFEQHIAAVLGKKHGLFFVTGVQAQLTAMKIHCDKAGNDRVSWHYRSHLEIAEGGAFSEVFRLQRTFVGKSQLEVPTVADVEAITSLPVEERPAVMLLELPNRELGCKTYPWDDLVQISKLCRAANVKLHMDGARLWEIGPYYVGKSYADVAALFDSVYVSFYKGLRGTCGAMLTSTDEDFIQKATTWQRRLGGNMVTSYAEIIDDERGFNLNIDTFHLKWQKMCSVASAIMEATKEYRTKEGKPIVFFVPEVPTCCQIHTHIQGVTSERLAAVRDEVEQKYRINVFPKVRPWQNWDEMEAEGTLVKGEHEPPTEGENDHHFLEWMIREENLNIGDDVFAKGWKALCQLIAASQ